MTINGVGGSSAVFAVGLRRAVLCPCCTEPGSIRGDYAIDVGRNIIHGSDAVESAKREIGLWFPEGLADNKPTTLNWIYEG